MNEITSEILHFLYDRKRTNKSVPLDILETNFGVDGYRLRGIIEDLKIHRFVVEDSEGVQITDNGINFGDTRWV